jgi:4'-phosphopantetheinyl transferase
MNNILLSGNELHIWSIIPSTITDNILLAQYWNILSESEKIKCNSFRFYKDKHRYLLTRVLVRVTLSRYYNYPLDYWYFSANKYGKPKVKNSCWGRDIPIYFNVSHTNGLIVCGFMKYPTFGLDTENISTRKTLFELTQYFCKTERDHIDNALIEEKNSLFLGYWTLKESYIKAKGLGLTIPLNSFSFDLTKNNIISFEKKYNINESDWVYALLKASDKHIVAVSSANTCLNISSNLHCWQTIPLKADKKEKWAIARKSIN